MKERPILFSAPMVRAILAGTKTQTRRIVKIQPRSRGDIGHYGLRMPFVRNPDSLKPNLSSPYGYPGDRLWVRENGWERPERTARMMRDGADTWAPYYFDADGITEQEAEDFKAWGFKRRPSIHMPRWASRILLEVVSVRIERLQDISEAEAMTEGITCYPFRPDDGFPVCSGYTHEKDDGKCLLHPSAAKAYRALWETINGDGSWDANPFVWVIEFKRVSA